MDDGALVAEDPIGRVLDTHPPVRDESIWVVFDEELHTAPAGAETFEIETLEPTLIGEGIEAWHGPDLFSITGESELEAGEFQLQSPGLGSIRMSAKGDAATALSPGERILAPRIIAETGRHLLRNVRLWFDEDPNVPPRRIEVLLPLIRLHRPARAGCSAECTVSRAEAEVVEAAFEVAGLGGGGEHRFQKGLQSVYRAQEACKEVAVPAACTIRFGSMILDENPVSYGSRIEIDEVHANKTVERALPDTLDLCGQTDPAGPSDEHSARENPPGPGDASDHSSRFEIETSGFISIGLDLGPHPLTMSTKLTRTLTYSYEVLTHLEGGADYRSYRASPTNPFELCWSTA